MKALTALLAGLVFGLGLAVSEMVNALKVLGFLDVFGHWDPSLAFVMGGAIAVSLPGFALLRKRNRPLLAPAFQWPQRTDIDRKLVLGAVIFGIGWGLAGYCPGPAIGGIALNLRDTVFWEPVLLTGTMLLGFLGWHLFEASRTAAIDG